jgi:hypothetical protein
MIPQEIKLLSLSQAQDLMVGIINGNRAEIEPHLEEIEAMLTKHYRKRVLLLIVAICELGGK